MSRTGIVIILFLLILVAGAIGLSRRDADVPTARVEKVIPNAALAQ